MKDEVDKKLNKIYFTSDKHNPYFTKDDRTLPEVLIHKEYLLLDKVVT